nr:MAG TPA: hypothetical protein [Caudoviricetes sp.]
MENYTYTVHFLLRFLNRTYIKTIEVLYRTPQKLKLVGFIHQ